MPPELIVTPAQVYELQPFSDTSEKTPSKDSTSKGKHEDSPSLPRKGDNSWSPERARVHQTQKTSLGLRCELSHEIQTRLSLQPSITLQQTVWTGVDYCMDCTTKTEPLSWGRAHTTNDSLLRSCSQKLSVLKKSKHTKKDKNLAQPEVRNTFPKMAEEDDSTPPLVNNKKKVKHKTPKKTKKTEQNLDLVVKIANDSKTETSGNTEATYSDATSTRKLSEGSWHQNRSKKATKQPVARSRFRKGGIVATATIHSYVDAESDDMDGSLETDKKKKKKKRKLIGMNRRVRKVIATVVATSHKPESEGTSISTKR